MSSPYSKRYNDLARQESEYKDVVISKLKSTAFELREGERECDDLDLRLNNLNHKLNLLHDEKALDEKEYRNRNELNNKTIYNLKKEVEALEAELDNIDADIAARRNDNDGINRIINTRSAELAKLKCEVADLGDDNKALTYDNKDLQQQINKLKAEIQEDLEYSQQINQKLDEGIRRRDENQKTIRGLEADEEALLKQNNQLKAEQKDLRLDASDKLEAVKDAEYAVAENKKDIAALQARLDNQKRANDKLNQDIALAQQEQKEENSRAADQTAKVKVLEDLNQEREDEIQLLRKEIARLRNERDDILDQNDDLNNDIEVCNKHLDALTQEHYQLLDEIEKFNDEDTNVRRVLQRESRVLNTKTKYEDKMRASFSTMNSSLQSPTRTAVNSALSKGAH